MSDRPRVLFVCTHNAGRSALAAALARAQFGDRIDVESAGVNPQDAPSDVTIASLAELGIDDSQHIPTALTPERVAAVRRGRCDETRLGHPAKYARPV